MQSQSPIIACMVISFLALLSMWRNGGIKNGLFVVGAFFALFAFGPVINYLAGEDIYPATVVSLIPKACFGFTLALLAIASVDRFVRQRTTFRVDKLDDEENHRYELLPIALFAASLYAAAMVLYRGPELLVATKHQALVLAGPGHRAYIFIGICFTAFFFITRRTRLMRQLYAVHIAAFLVYSLAFRERDFLLVFMSVLVHRDILREKARSVRLALAGVGSVIVATLLFSFRAGGGFNVIGVLNQGLLLFVDTYLMNLVPAGGQGHFWGGTYVDTVQRLPPRFLYNSGEISLPQWFVEIYNPGASVGYGFSMTGEAYINFGIIGIPLVFALVALFQRSLVNRIDRSDWFGYGSIYFTATWMYALRGDSLQLVKTMLFGSIVFALFRIISRRKSKLDAASAVGEHQGQDLDQT